MKNETFEISTPVACQRLPCTKQYVWDVDNSGVPDNQCAKPATGIGFDSKESATKKLAR